MPARAIWHIPERSRGAGRASFEVLNLALEAIELLRSIVARIKKHDRNSARQITDAANSSVSTLARERSATRARAAVGSPLARGLTDPPHSPAPQPGGRDVVAAEGCVHRIIAATSVSRAGQTSGSIRRGFASVPGTVARKPPTTQHQHHTHAQGTDAGPGCRTGTKAFALRWITARLASLRWHRRGHPCAASG